MDTMARLEDIHRVAWGKLQKRFSLTPVDLKYPMPERPLRALGLIKLDGKAYRSNEFLRVVLMNITLAFVSGVRTVFLSPQVELGLPVFSSEIILTGNSRTFFLDVQRRGGYDRHDDTEIYNRLVAIKDRYRTLLANTKTQRGEIQKTFSKAACYVKITKDQDEQAMNLFHEYLDVYLEVVQQAQPLIGEALELARREYDAYTNTVIDHDPAAQVYKLLFGKKGGVERTLDLFFPC
jgi:hypothetical protein